MEASLLLSRTDGTSSSASRSGHPANDRFVMEAVGRFETYPYTWSDNFVPISFPIVQARSQCTTAPASL